MATKGRGPRLARTAAVLLTVLTAALTVLAWHRDRVLLHDPWLVAGDLAVGLAFPVAALLCKVSTTSRLALAAVGPAWLAGSASPWFVAAHHGALIVALTCLPLVRRRPTALTLAVGTMVAAVAPGALVTAFVYVAFAALFALEDLRSVIRRRGFPALAAAGIAGALLHAEWLAVTGRPAEPLAYDLAFLTCAAACVPWSRWADRRRREFGSLALTGAMGVEGLGPLLATALRDPGLTIAADGRVRSTSSSLADPVVARSVAEAVRVVLRRDKLHRADEVRVTALEAARARVVTAVDDERARVGEELERRVCGPLDVAIGRTREAAPEVCAALQAARIEMGRLVTGLPPLDLATVGLARALTRVALSAPIEVEVDIAGPARREVEAALFFVSSEALTNAIKHGAASRIRFRTTQSADGLTYTAEDDGRGGADVTGSGLVGLSDRVEAVGGTLDVLSPPGRGTSITVRLSPEALGRDLGDVRDPTSRVTVDR